MRGQRYWVKAGKLAPETNDDLVKVNADEYQKLREGVIRITTGDLGTEVKWFVNSPCTASLFTIIQWLSSARGPFVLRFHAVGWFEEFYEDPAAAVRRLEDILARGDRHFTGRTFVEEQALTSLLLPDVLKQSLERQVPADEYTVDCAYDVNSKHFVVERVGPKSAIGRLWGTVTSSYPCQPMGTYGDTISAAYEEVMDDGIPRYHHVLAALRLPDNQVHWVPYHRLIFPKRVSAHSVGVSVVSQIAKVDIRVL